MTLIQAQQRYIDRVNACTTGHIFRVRRGAWSQLYAWATAAGYDPKIVCKDAKDMAELERNAED